ncbi:MAG: YraN family protein [Candidatus Parcubacteria bacterium]|nr:YraN family protein [Candidatus Parcubacteria bacterium]
MSKTEKQETGDIGEKIAGLFLKTKGFTVIGTNYRKPWGEIDIIVQKKGKIHFIEVKTVKTRENQNRLDKGLPLRRSGERQGKGSLLGAIILGKFLPQERSYAIKEIFEGDGETKGYRPEDNLHPWKLQRLKRAIISYLEEKRMSEEDDWQFDAVTVRLNEERKTALVEYLGDIIL